MAASAPRTTRTPTGPWGFLEQLALSAAPLALPAVAPVETVSAARLAKDPLLRRSVFSLLSDDRVGAMLKRSAEIQLLRLSGVARTPIVLSRVLTASGAAHLVILAEPGAEATIIERFDGASQQALHGVELFLGADAHISYASAATFSGDYLSEKRAILSRDASLLLFELIANTGKARSRAGAFLDGEGAAASCQSIFLAPQHSSFDLGADALHIGHATSSRLLSRGMLVHAKGIYEGVLRIGSDAQKSDAFQAAHTLLIDGAEMKASPRLFIDNNDVTCSHAATTSNPDVQKLYYLMSRGLVREDALELVARAFVWPAIEGTAFERPLGRDVEAGVRRALEVRL